MKRIGIFYGWYVIIALLIIGLIASCVRYALPVFIPSLLKDFSWTRTTVGFAFTINFWVSAIAAPLVGIFVDRLGGRFVTTIGGVSLLASTILLSTITNVSQLYLYYGLIAGFGIGCTFYVPLTAITRKWFIKKAGLAVSIVLTGTGLGIAIAPPIARALIDTFGWRESFLWFGIPSGIICILVASIIIRNYPESVGLLPDGEVSSTSSTLLEGDSSDSAYATMFREQSWGVKDALKTSSFWFLDLAYGLSWLGVIAAITHLITWAQDLQIDRVSASFALLFMGICSVLTRIVGGLLRDYFGGKVPIYISMIGMVAITLYALKVDDTKSLYIFAIVAGMFYGIHVPIWTPLLGDLFGRKSVGTLMGFLSLSFGCISGSGPAIFGWIYDTYGTYNLGFIFSGVCYVVTMLLVFLIRPVRLNDLKTFSKEV